MIIDKITFNNFGTYQGKQIFDLTPKQANRPIILVGGLNGAGKTSLLNGVQLALYGKRARILSRGNGGYLKQLANYMHWETQLEAPTSVVLEFRATQQGIAENLRLERSWEINGSADVVESFQVWKDGELDSALTSTWDEYVERLIPVGISHLFFFDGEKVEHYAQKGRTKELLKTGVHALLGVDLVERLQKDIKALIRNKTKETRGNSELKRIAQIEEELEALEAQHKDLEQKLIDQSDTKLTIEKKIKAIEKRLVDAGIGLFYQKLDLQKALEKERKNQAALKRELIDLAGGVLPLTLLEGLVGQVSQQAQNEHTAIVGIEMLESLSARDQKVLSLLSEAPDSLREIVDNYFSEDRANLEERTRVEQYLSLSSEAENLLKEVTPEVRHQRGSANNLLNSKKTVEDKIKAITAQLELVPKEEDLADMLSVRDGLESQMTDAKKTLIDLELKVERVGNSITTKEQMLDKQIDKGAKVRAEQEESGRTVAYGKKTIAYVQKFQGKLVESAVGQVEDCIRSSLEVVFRKKGFITNLKIDPATYEMTIYGHKGKELSPSALSAGERQLLILSTLWGLARASERPLPVIIDTPLGRLDSTHRENLIKHYFPVASHQVILLSTDEEIDQNYDEQLKPNRSHGYNLHFNPAIQATDVKNGYFWD